MVVNPTRDSPVMQQTSIALPDPDDKDISGLVDALGGIAISYPGD